MNTEKQTTKTQGTWTTPIEELYTSLGLTLKIGDKTDSCIMPAPKHLRSAKQQQDTQNNPQNQNE